MTASLSFQFLGKLGVQRLCWVNSVSYWLMKKRPSHERLLALCSKCLWFYGSKNHFGKWWWLRKGIQEGGGAGALCTCCTASLGRIAPFQHSTWKARTIASDADSAALPSSPSPRARSSQVLQTGRLETSQSHLLTTSLLCCKHRDF